MDEQNNQEEEQLLMDQETGLEKAAGKGAQMIGNAAGTALKEEAKEVGKEVAKEGAKVAGEGIKIFVGTIGKVIALIPIPVWIAIVVIITLIAIYFIIDSFTGLFNGENSKGIIDTKAYITSDANGIILSSDNDIKETIKEQIKTMGMKDIKQLGLGEEKEALEYLVKFYKATMSTQLPYIPGVEDISDQYVQGIVHIKRTDTTVDGARELNWMGY